MSAMDPDRLPLVHIMNYGVQGDDTLALVTAEFRRRVIEATIESAPSMAAAARTLGITREGLYGLRRRYGLPIVPQESKPIPQDWRQRLG